MAGLTEDERRELQRDASLRELHGERVGLSFCFVLLFLFCIFLLWIIFSFLSLLTIG